MKVLLLTQWFHPEPESSRGLPFARWLQARGHDVTILTGFPNYPKGELYPGYKLKVRQWDEVQGVKVLRVPLYPNHDTSASKRIVNYASFAAAATVIGMPLVGDVDVVYAMATPPTTGLPPFFNQIFRRVPYLFNVTDLFPDAVLESGMVQSKVKTAIIRRSVEKLVDVVYGNAAYVTAISRGYRDILIERGLPAEKVHTIFNWVDEDLFHPVPRNEELAQRLGLAGKTNFIYAGNFGPLQGIDTIIRAAAHLQHIPDLQIALVGTGQLDAELRALAASLNLKNVHFTGRVQQHEMPDIYALADVLLIHLNTSEYLRATVPSKTQASLSVGRPVAMAAIGDAPDIIKESGAGLVCEPRDPAALADVMLRLYNMPHAEREEMGQKGRAFYLDHMSLDHGGAELERLLLRAAEGR
jgi:colanic acid biosynthesis glycosyl transferase WcaI